MGNRHSKKESKLQFSLDQLKTLEDSFRGCGPNNEKLQKEDLLKSWSNIIDPHLAQCTANFLFKLVGQVTPVISLDRYAEPYYIVERGAIDDKVNFLATSLEQTDTNQFTIKELEYYVAAVLKSYLKSLQSMEAFESWNQHGYQSSDRSVYAFSRGLIRSMSQDHDHFLNLRMLEEWLRVNPTFLILWRDVFTYVYSKKSSKSFKSGIGLSCNLLPVLDGLATGTNYTPILDIPHIIFVNSNLPNEYRNKWRFLFSSKIMGESFSTMLAKIVNKGPTLLVVEDEDRYVFAGFCPVSWSLKSQFFGNESSMLYTLSPEMRCFNSTGYNDHYQYLNLNQQTMPNGLGMGGQLYYWGLWIDSDYGLGQSSESCTSFRDYVQLSKKQNFRIRNMEVWGIGEEPKDEDYEYGEGDGKNSILDTNLEDKVMLQLAGKEIYSEGLREPDMDF